MKKMVWVLNIFSCCYLCAMDHPKKEKSRITLSFPKVDKEKKVSSEDTPKKNSPSNSGNTTPCSAERRLSSLEEMKNAYQDRKKQSVEPQLPK